MVAYIKNVNNHQANVFTLSQYVHPFMALVHCHSIAQAPGCMASNSCAAKLVVCTSVVAAAAPRLVLHPHSGAMVMLFCTLRSQGRVVVDTLLSGAVSDAEIVFEAVLEDLEVKNSLFRGEFQACVCQLTKLPLHRYYIVFLHTHRYCVGVFQGDHPVHQYPLTAAVRCVLRCTPSRGLCNMW